jgi:hypothetical protein
MVLRWRRFDSVFCRMLGSSDDHGCTFGVGVEIGASRCAIASALASGFGWGENSNHQISIRKAILATTTSASSKVRRCKGGCDFIFITTELSPDVPRNLPYPSLCKGFSDKRSRPLLENAGRTKLILKAFYQQARKLPIPTPLSSFVVVGIRTLVFKRISHPLRTACGQILTIHIGKLLHDFDGLCIGLKTLHLEGETEDFPIRVRQSPRKIELANCKHKRQVTVCSEAFLFSKLT